MSVADLILVKRLTNDEVVKDSRFRRAVNSGEYFRSLSVFLRIQYPDIKDLSTLSRDYAAVAALFDALKKQAIENLKEG